MSSEPKKRKWYQYVGPGLITACVVIGPGSILTSSRTGADNGFSMSWVVLVAVLFMSVYLALGARLGVVASQTPGKLITDRVGRWLAVLIGVSVFFISAAFQFGNNLGVDSAFLALRQTPEKKVDKQPTKKVGDNVKGEDAANQAAEPGKQTDGDQKEPEPVKSKGLVIILINLLAISFLFIFKNLYKAVERMMMVFVGLMLVSFAVNLSFAFMSRPDVGASVAEALSGLIPRELGAINLSVLGLVGTTFVISAAYYQSFLVQQKGWGKTELKSGLVDARVSAAIMGIITLMIMWTAASVLRGEKLTDVVQVSQQLRPLFGKYGQVIFCLGLFSAAFSSFLVNSMIGGFIFSDGLGCGSKPQELGPKLATTLVLLTGMTVALILTWLGWSKLPAIIAAQAVTVVASPMIAGALWWLTNRRDIMGDQTNGPVVNVLAGIGFALLLGMAFRTAFVVLPANIDTWKKNAAAKKAGGEVDGNKADSNSKEKGK